MKDYHLSFYAFDILDTIPIKITTVTKINE